MTAESLSAGASPELPRSRRLPRALVALRPLIRDPFICAMIVVLLLLAIIALVAPLIAPYDPSAINAFNAAKAPSPAHWAGTDENGRDVLTRLMYGARIALSVGVISVGFAVIIGVPLGLLSGYAGGFVDSLIMRVMDSILAFPAVILALAIIAILGYGLGQLMVAIGFTSIPIYARIVRAQVLSVKHQDYITAARTVGAPTWRILFVHILPNITAPIIVQASLGMAFAILAEAGLSFLGLGVQPPTPTWGGMLQRALPRIHDAPMLSVLPGLAIFVVVLAFNVVGDGLRDVLDPRLRGKLK